MSSTRMHTFIVALVASLGMGSCATSAHAQKLPRDPAFVAHVMAPDRSPDLYQRIATWFEESQFLSRLANSLNEAILVPRHVLMLSGECGVKNAFYRPDGRYPAVVICYEMVEDIINEFRYDALTEQQKNTAVFGTVAFIVFHEVGHALVDVLSLPITGREEDAVDQLATLFLSQADPVYPYWAAEYFMQAEDLGDMGLFKGLGRGGSAFADEHSLDEQRFFNIICWTYGGDPERRTFLLEQRFFPRHRAERCPREYQQMAGAWETLLADHLRDEPSSISNPSDSLPGLRIAGSWTFTETLEDATGTVRCENSGTLQFEGADSAFVGRLDQQGKCNVLGSSFNNAGTGVILDGQVDVNVIRFQVDTCHYAGTYNGGDTLGGTVECSAEVAGKSRTLTGRWTAMRRRSTG